ncbi:MAG: PilT/PilU family type 4a pilus ATPase, partial [Candidatus Nanopelagicales bacterium]
MAVTDMVSKGGPSVETSGFSGAPAGEEPQPPADFGFFAPPEEPVEGEAPRELSALDIPSTEQIAEQALEPAVEPALAPGVEPVLEQTFDPNAYTPETAALLDPQVVEPASVQNGLPMSLTIAAEEAATVDVDTLPEPTVSPYESFHSEQPVPAPEAGAATNDVLTESALTDAVPAELAPNGLADVSAGSLDEAYLGVTSEAAAVPTAALEVADPGVELADSEAGDDAYARVSTEPTLGGEDIILVDLLLVMLERGASDLHITAGARPAIRVNGELEQMEEYPVLTPPVIQRVMYAAITQRQREQFEEIFELDFAYSVPGRARFRVNMYKQRDAVGAAFRIIPFEIKRLEDLGVPTTVANFAMLPRGFVLVTGPTGSGKSTTLASLVDLANRQRKEHIMTCEDPIEFLHRHQSCLVNQREVGEDTKSFQAALKHVLRQDPDIILVGEMRDLETISVALTAAETGHLVFATLHTQDAAQTID